MTERIAEVAVPSNPLVVLLPVFNDWPALNQLAIQLDCVLAECGLEANVLIIDDSSTTPIEEPFPRSFVALRRVEVLRLRRNLGHQRAIAIGLAYIVDKVPCQAVILMDSDGEDDPRDVPRLLKKYHEETGQKIIFAERTKRSESWVFRIFYALYRALHYLLTSERVRVGNFSVIPPCRLASLAVVSEMWNHYAAAVFKSRQPFDTVPTRRAPRLAGKSKMNFVGLVVHGLSAISVFSDIVGVRLLVIAFGFILLALSSIGCVVAIRVLTNLAIPGWATFTTGILVIIFLQATLFSLIFSLLILGSRQGLAFLPLRDYHYFVDTVKVVYSK